MSSTALVSAALAAAACYAAVSCGGGRLLTRRLPVVGRGGGASVRPPRRAGVATALAASLATAAWYRFSIVLVAAVAAAAALGLVTLRKRAVSRRSAVARSAAVVEICDQLAAELRAGQPPAQALAHTARSWPELEPAATAARLGGNVPDALRALSVVPGGAALARVAAAWQVAHRTGAGLAGVLSRLADGLREQDATRQEVMATLAAPRATARLLALLPAFGLLLGEGLGADPWRFLVASPLGLLCLALGCGLALAGLAWVERLADRAEALR